MPLTNFPNGITVGGIYTQGVGDDVEQTTTASVMPNNLVVFTVVGGPIKIVELFSVCQTANDTTASTLQWTAVGTLGTTSATITGASATLASAVIGTNVALQGTALTTAPVINANGVNVSTNAVSIIVPAGTLKLTIGVGSTTGTWQHYIRYSALSPASQVTPAF